MKLWGGRFKEETSDKFFVFSSSIKFDFRLAEYDIIVNRAWAKMLERIDLLSQKELIRITKALDEVQEDLQKKRLRPEESSEDIHSLIEERLFTYAGSVSKKLPVGRSRNELISTEVRLYLRDVVDEFVMKIKNLQRKILAKATENAKIFMPYFTHLQPATPGTVGHFLLSYFWKLERDKKFFKFVKEEINSMPLGSGAVGGTTIPIDTEFLMRELGFSKICENSVDATSERDFIIYFLEACANLQVHLCLISEDFVIFSTPAFDFLELPEAFSTGSSLMPQKKNPDFFELVRGKTAKIIAGLDALLLLLKGIPSGYNRDLQEDKIHLFGIIDEVNSILELFPNVFSEIRFKESNMKKLIEKGEICAQSLAEYLAMKGVPFRCAHEIVGRIIRDNETLKRKMQDLTLDVLKSYSEFFTADVIPLLSPEGILEQLQTPSSPQSLSFEAQLRSAYAAVEE